MCRFRKNKIDGDCLVDMEIDDFDVADFPLMQKVLPSIVVYANERFVKLEQNLQAAYPVCTVPLEKVLEETERCAEEWCHHPDTNSISVIISGGGTFFNDITFTGNNKPHNDYTAVSSSSGASSSSKTHSVVLCKDNRRKSDQQICWNARPEGRDENPQRTLSHTRTLGFARGRLGNSSCANEDTVHG